MSLGTVGLVRVYLGASRRGGKAGVVGGDICSNSDSLHVGSALTSA